MSTQHYAQLACCHSSGGGGLLRRSNKGDDEMPVMGVLVCKREYRWTTAFTLGCKV